MAEQFTRWTFLGNQQHPERIRLDIDHANRDAGKCVGLHVIGGWWVGRFRVNHTLIGALAEDKLHIGRAVSIGFDVTLQHRMGQSDVREYQMACLNEVSIVDSGAYDGAKIVSKIPITPTPRRSRITAPEPSWLPAAREAAAARGNLVRVFDTINVRIT